MGVTTVFIKFYSCLFLHELQKSSLQNSTDSPFLSIVGEKKQVTFQKRQINYKKHSPTMHQMGIYLISHANLPSTASIAATSLFLVITETQG